MLLRGLAAYTCVDCEEVIKLSDVRISVKPVILLFFMGLTEAYAAFSLGHR